MKKNAYFKREKGVTCLFVKHFTQSYSLKSKKKASIAASRFCFLDVLMHNNVQILVRQEVVVFFFFTKCCPLF